MSAGCGRRRKTVRTDGVPIAADRSDALRRRTRLAVRRKAQQSDPGTPRLIDFLHFCRLLLVSCRSILVPLAIKGNSRIRLGNYAIACETEQGANADASAEHIYRQPGGARGRPALPAWAWTICRRSASAKARGMPRSCAARWPMAGFARSSAGGVAMPGVKAVITAQDVGHPLSHHSVSTSQSDDCALCSAGDRGQGRTLCRRADRHGAGRPRGACGGCCRGRHIRNRASAPR